MKVLAEQCCRPENRLELSAECQGESNFSCRCSVLGHTFLQQDSPGQPDVPCLSSHCRARAKRTRTHLSSIVTQRADRTSTICPRIEKGHGDGPRCLGVSLTDVLPQPPPCLCTWFHTHHIKELVEYICWLTERAQCTYWKNTLPSRPGVRRRTVH